jgi:hypothetical protein
MNKPLFSQGMFTYDPNTTPEQLAKKREALRNVIFSGESPKYVGDGLTRLAAGFFDNIAQGKMDKFESEKRGEAAKITQDMVDRFYGGNSGSSWSPFTVSSKSYTPEATPTSTAPAATTTTEPQPTEADLVANDAMAAIGRDDLVDPFAATGQAPAGVPQDSGIAAAPDMSGMASDRGMLAMPEEIKNGIFAGESGGDYDALFGFSNRDGGRYSNVKLTDMTVDQALDFANPSGDYGQWVKGQVGRVATPMGAYQVVGTTLREAKDALGLTGNEKMTPELQDAIGAYILKTQGTGAWEGYKGPSDSYTPASGGTRVSTMGGGYSGPSVVELQQALANPWLTQSQRQTLTGMMAQAQQATDPMYQLELQRAQLELEQMRNGTGNKPASVIELEWRAQQAGLQPGTPEYQSFILNGSGDPATFRALDMQAQAAGFQPGTPEYANFMATRGAGLQAGAKVTAENLADIATGGAAEQAKDLGKAAADAGMSAWESYGKLNTSIANIDEAIAALDAGAKSGPIYKMLPSVTEASASLENAMQRMGLDIVGATTFGALSEGELRLALSTAVPQNLKPEDLRNWLVRRREAQAKAAAMAADAAQFLTVPGNTINDWIARNKGQGGAQSGQGGTSKPATHRFNPETGKIEAVQ